MTQFSSSNQSSGLIDGITQAAEHAQASAHSFAQHTQAEAASTLLTLIHDVGPKLNRMADQLGSLSHQGAKSVASGSRYLSDHAHHAADSTVGYIRKDPATAVLLAAGVGALLVAAWVAVTRARSSH